MMTPSLIQYLMRKKNYVITIASNILEDAKTIADEYPGRAHSCYLDVSNEEATKELVEQNDIVVSFIPPFLHPKIFKACADAKRNLVTASYISEEMMTYDEQAKKDGLIFLNECGLDPGIDIMSTMKIKDEVEAKGGKITKYESWCGGLPCAEDSDNPLGYKFSWDPKAVFKTSRNQATFLKDGEVINIQPDDLLSEGTRVKDYVKALNLEGYPNRDSLAFKEAFGFKDAKTFVRGTIRYGGFRIIMRALHQIGITEAVQEIDQSKIKTLRALTESFAEGIDAKVEDYTEQLNSASITDEEDQKLISKLLQKIDNKDNIVDIINSWKFFELLNPDRNIEESWKTPLDALSTISLEKMSYGEGERDFVVMKHIFEIETAEGEKKTLHSTMLATGDKVGSGGLTVMAKTVGFAAGAAVNLILEGKIKAKGVLSPKTPEFYNQILPILEEDNITLVEEEV